ncbi:hypothetical protein [Methyloceanibacter stevinii]|uniref:hypothetical protein n=1 Tax=Methyloceanibacter stevinii TaxID=1774970 RepID=UPI00114CB919|nr:hypothetical protein [Methyloceanibacter stevinii]
MTSVAHKSIGRFMRAIGILLMATAVVFVGLKIRDSYSLLASDFGNSRFLGTIAIGMCVYAALAGLIGTAWVVLVSGAGHTLGLRDGLIIFGRSQILKYLPSNVLHLAGRYTMARAAGASHASLIFSTGAEAAILIMAASTVAVVFALPLFLSYVVGAFGTSYGPIAILVALGVLLLGSLWWLRREGMLTHRLGAMTFAAYCLYLCFFVVNGLLLWLLLAAVDSGARHDPFSVLGVAAAAWIGGFVVPGAPAGLGIREVILTSGLDMAGYGTSALAAALGYRIATFGGDIILASVSLVLRRR